ncbi:MAG: META domain-containing protein [Planctomycetes bacterium]|nr:META domain-containing protein [Planctomycetota bacterium]
MTRLCTLLLLALFAVGCSSLGATDPAELRGGEWVVVRLEADPVPEGAGLTLRFEEAQLSGNSGVNAFHGAVVCEADGTFEAGPFALTRRAGPPEAMARESLMLVALERADRWRIERGELHLIAGDSTLLVCESR